MFRRNLHILTIVSSLMSVLPVAFADAPKPAKGLVNVAALAEIATAPAVTPSGEARLVDGLSGKGVGVAFEVGTQGPGAYTFKFGKARSVQSLHFHQSVDIYMAQSFRVLADVDGKGEYVVELAAGQCPAPPSWSSVAWPPRKVYGLRLQIVKGASKGRRAHPVCSEIMIFGEPLKGDTVRKRRLGRPVAAIEVVRRVRREINLSVAGRPVAVLVPQGEEWAEAGRALAEDLNLRFGVQATVTTQPAEALPEKITAVAVGNVNNNELAARLYFNHYAYADSLFPGDGEFTLRTVFEPYPWCSRGDVILIGCSDLAGARRGVAELLKRVEQNGRKLAYTHVVSKPDLPALKGGKEPTLLNFRQAVDAYFRTGHVQHARRAVAILEAIDALYNEKYANTDDVPIAWSEEIQSNYVFAGWDAFEEFPELTDDQRLRFTRNFLKALHGLTRHVSGWATLDKQNLVAWNHTTYPLRGVYFASRYFARYYGITAARDYLKKAFRCFMAQARSWKPQEDSDIYLEPTMEPCRGFWLAEWRLDFFENGSARNYAEYVLATADSQGLSGGFGDSTLSRIPSVYLRTLPPVYWFTRDPRYLWALQKATGGTWANPFHRDVAPSPDTEHVGVRVFPLDPQLYAYTGKFSYYNEPLSKPNVPLAEAFDKIAFRESWAPDAQYLLLDGFSRGKHLHYDGNSINTFVDRGRKWLIDHDYLVRNTTEHNMASVIRNGRSDQLVPSCAGLVAQGDGPQVGMTTTRMADYMGLDWSRSLFWRKGEYFVAMERFTPREAADYDIDLTWKLEDWGVEAMAGAGVFRALRPEVVATNRGLLAIDDETAQGGKALLFTQSTSRCAFAVELPPGDYLFRALAYGLDGSSDSMYVKAVSSPRLELHVNKKAYAWKTASRGFGKPGAHLALGPGRRHVICLWMRERPPVRIDAFAFHPKDGGAPVILQAESIERPRPEDMAGIPGDRFWIKCADSVRARVTRHTTHGITAPLCKLWQRASGRMQPESDTEMANLFYADSLAEPVDRTLLRVAPRAVLVAGENPALCVIHGGPVEGVETDAETLYLTADRVAWAGGSRIALLGKAFVNEARTSGELPLPAELRGGVVDLLKRLAANAKPIQEGNGTAVQPARPVWAFDTPADAPVARLRQADLDGDGAPEILVAASAQAVALSADGTLLWRHALNGLCNDINAGELDVSPGLEVVAASSEDAIHLLDARGTLLRSQSVMAVPRTRHYGETPQQPLAASIYNTDGTPRVFVSTQNYDIITYDAKLARLAVTRNITQHGGMEFHAADVNGDGKREVFCTDHYGFFNAVSPEGKKVYRYYTSIGDMQAAVGDIGGDGVMEAVYGSSTGDLLCLAFTKGGVGGRGGAVWRFDNYGYPVNRLRIADADGDGKNDVLVASGTGYVYALDGAGKALWRTRVGADVRDVVVVTHPKHRIACIDRSGVVTLLDGRGGVTGSFSVEGEAQHMLWTNKTLVVATDARVAAFALP